MNARAALIAVLLSTFGAPVLAQGFPVSGTFAYSDKEWDFNGWTGVRPERPIRGADVRVIDDTTGKVLGRGITAADGSFTVFAKTKLPHPDVVVRVESRNRERRLLPAPFTGITLLSATGDPYAAFSPVFASHDSSLPLDVGTTVAQSITVADEEGNPFNVFDAAVSAFDYVHGAAVGAKPRGSVTLHWPSFTGSWALGRHAWIGSDDGDDDSVILHELGHLVHNIYSDSDSPGGVHYFGDSDQDPRLSFAEGFATFFGGCVQQDLGRPALYVDCDAAVDTSGVQLHLSLEECTPFLATAEGASDEVAVACVLHDLVDDESTPDTQPGVDDDSLGAGTLIDGLTPTRALWAVFCGPVRKASRLTMDHVWDGWLTLHAQDTHYDQLSDVFEQQRMRFWPDAFEPDGTSEAATLLVPLSGADWGPEHTLYDAPPGSDQIGTGDRDWFAVDLVAGQLVRLETRYPGGAWDARTQVDTFLTLHAPDGRTVATDEDSGAGRNARLDAVVVDETGRWTFEVRSRNRTHRYGRYEVRVVLLPSS